MLRCWTSLDNYKLDLLFILKPRHLGYDLVACNLGSLYHKMKGYHRKSKALDKDCVQLSPWANAVNNICKTLQ